jgi:hypothetical protein
MTYDDVDGYVRSRGRKERRPHARDAISAQPKRAKRAHAALFGIGK